jgi:peptidoglycan/xylan/chitin deacetylase (PgdA/CDA1 family)
MIHGGRRLRWAPQRASRWLRQRFTSSALVLVYHRVIELPSDPQLLAVTPHHFAEQLEVLSSNAHVLTMAQLVKAVRGGRVPHRSVVVTFDDGYADNLFNARPLLERYEVPATVFVTSGQVGSSHEFWWDELDRLLLQAGALPPTLSLEIAGVVRRWVLDGAAEYDCTAFHRYCGWHIERRDEPTARQSLYRSVYQLLHGLRTHERARALDELQAWARVRPMGRQSHRALTADELCRLSACDLIEIGSHALTHPVLAELPASAQRTEVQGSKANLEEILGQTVATFAYPHGSATAETVAIVREAGYQSACTTRPDVVWSKTDLLRLPRVGVRNWDGEAFAQMLRYWLDG